MNLIALRLLLTAAIGVCSCVATLAKSPTSPNRLVFNHVDVPGLDLNGDGQLDILDAMQGLPAATDAIVYIGADSALDLYAINTLGSAVVQEDISEFARIEEAARLASELSVPLFLRGHFAAIDSIRLHSNTFVEGYSSTPPNDSFTVHWRLDSV